VLGVTLSEYVDTYDAKGGAEVGKTLSDMAIGRVLRVP
jgi:hypothetical protein